MSRDLKEGFDVCTPYTGWDWRSTTGRGEYLARTGWTSTGKFPNQRRELDIISVSAHRVPAVRLGFQNRELDSAVAGIGSFARAPLDRARRTVALRRDVVHIDSAVDQRPADGVGPLL